MARSSIPLDQKSKCTVEVSRTRNNRFPFGRKIDYLATPRDASIDSATIKGARIDAVTRGDVSEFSDSGIRGIREDPLMKPFSWTDLPLSRGWERESFLYRARSISDQTFQLRISARSAIDPPSNLERNSRSPVVVRWTSSESPPFPMPCRAYDLDLVSLSRSTYSSHGHPRASIEFPIVRATKERRMPPPRWCHRVFVSRPIIFLGPKSVVGGYENPRCGIVYRACPRGFWLMSRVHPRSQGYGCEQLGTKGRAPRRG